MNKSLLAALVVGPATCLAAPTPSPAQETQPAAPKNGASALSEGVEPAGPPKFIFGSLSSDFTTHYFKRGILQEDQGLIAQPMFNLIIGAYKSDKGPVDQAGFVLGSRESVHSKDTGSTDSPAAWYEADYYAGFSVQALHRLRFDTTYVAITSPNGAFDTIQEMDFQLTFLDDGLLGDVTLHPYVLFVRELNNSALGGPEGSYLEFGMEPSFPLIRSERFPVTLSFPARVGLSVDEYYQLPTPFGFTLRDETWGYTQVGVTASMPLTFVPKKFGSVTVSAGVDFLCLSSGNLTLVNHNSRHEIIGRVGFVWSF